MHSPRTFRRPLALVTVLTPAVRTLLISVAAASCVLAQVRPPGGGGGGGVGPGVVRPGGGAIPVPPGGLIGGGGGGGTPTTPTPGPRIVTNTGALVGQPAQATVVIVGSGQTAAQPAGPGQPGGNAAGPTTYQWSITGGRITTDATRPTVSYIADSPGTVSLSVTTTTNGVATTASIDVTWVSPALAGTITTTDKVTTGATNLTASVPPAQSGDRTFRWTVTGGTITAGQNTNSVTLRAGNPGLMEVSCAVMLQRVVTVNLRSFVVVLGDGAATALTINNGSGGGTFPAGSRIDIFADPPPAGQVFDRWTGNVEVLGNATLAPFLSRAIATVPATPATLTATYKPAPAWTPTVVNNFNPIAQTSPEGTTLTYHLPANAQGVVFLLHETGGTGATWFTNPEQLELARDLVAAGFGVAALNSANRTAGAWSAQATLANNPDASTIAAALAKFVADKALPATQPVFLLGVGNGGDAAARFAEQLATATPPRPVKGAILYCSIGSATLAVTSRVPQYFALASNDEVIGAAGNAAARENVQLLSGRGIATGVVSNTPAPVHAGRFRVLGLTATSFTAADAQAIWTALKAAGILDANNYVKSVPDAATLRAALPATYQARTAEIAAQLSVAYAARGFYGDANARVLNFMNARVANQPVPAPGRLINLSTRTKIAFLGDTFTLGFNIAGTQRAQLLIRGIGPALAKFGLPGALSAPRLEVLRGANVIASNEGWDKAANAAEIAAAATAVGAFALGAADLDAAVLVTLDPGTYTATITGLGGTTGDVLAEVYDVSRNDTRLTNLSTLGKITSEGDLLIPGIVVAGNNPRTLVVRAVGPGLTDFGLPADAVLGDPRISIVTTINGTSQTIALNNNWTQGGAGLLGAVFPAVGAFALKTTNGDAALVDALAPGTYTLQAGPQPLPTPPPGGDAPTVVPPSQVGSVLVEVYEVP